MATTSVTRSLSEVLQEAQPSWTSRNLASVKTKLADVGIDSTNALAAALQGKLNERLRGAGHKVFAVETLRALKSILCAEQRCASTVEKLSEAHVAPQDGGLPNSCADPAVGVSSGCTSHEEQIQEASDVVEMTPSQHNNQTGNASAVSGEARDLPEDSCEGSASSELERTLKFQYLSGETLDLDLAGLDTAGEVRTCVAEFLRLPYERIKLVGCQSVELKDSEILSVLTDVVHVVVSADPLDETLAEAAGVTDMGKLEVYSSLDLMSKCLKALPERIGQLRNLQKLDLSYNKLKELPNSFGNLTALSTLDLSENQLQSMPESFSQLAALKDLDLKSNQLKALPASFGDLALLSNFNAMYCDLEALPSSFCSLTSLKNFSCRANQLTALPDGFGELRSLTSVNLSNNALVILPESFSSLDALVHLQLASNQLTTLPRNFGKLMSLQKLDLERNQLQELPDSFGNLRVLSELQLSSNHLQRLPDSFGHLSKLYGVNLRNNRLEALPQTIVKLEALGALDVSDNPMSLLPRSKFQRHPNMLVLSLLCKFGSLHSLRFEISQSRPVPEHFLKFFASEDIDLTRCALKVLPEAVSRLNAVQKMHLGYNGLKIIPSSFYSLNCLSILDLSHNSLVFLSESIGRLANLELLDLSHNMLARLPVGITELRHLKKFSIAHNQLTLLPESIGQLVLLTHLELQHNWLTSVPESLDELLHLEFLDLRCNPFQGLEQEFENHPARRIFFLMNKYDALKTLLLWPEQEGKMPDVVQIPPPRGGQRSLAAGPRPSYAKADVGGGTDKRVPQKTFTPPPRPAMLQDEPRKTRTKGKTGFLTGDAGLHAAMAEVQEILESAEGSSKEEKQKILKQLFFAWHPDKCPGEEALATKVFQWLQDVKDRYL